MYNCCKEIKNIFRACVRGGNGRFVPGCLPTNQQAMFALLVPSCQQVWNHLLTVVTTLLILSALLQGCYPTSPIQS